VQLLRRVTSLAVSSISTLITRLDHRREPEPIRRWYCSLWYQAFLTSGRLSGAAILTRSAREPAFSFRITCPRCAAVISLMCRLAATFIQQAKDDQCHHVPLGTGKRGVTFADGLSFRLLSKYGLAPLDGVLDRVQ